MQNLQLTKKGILKLLADAEHFCNRYMDLGKTNLEETRRNLMVIDFISAEDGKIVLHANKKIVKRSNKIAGELANEYCQVWHKINFP